MMGMMLLITRSDTSTKEGRKKAKKERKERANNRSSESRKQENKAGNDILLNIQHNFVVK